MFKTNEIKAYKNNPRNNDDAVKPTDQMNKIDEFTNKSNNYKSIFGKK